jgi:cytochrome c oxidase subunit IV
VETVRLSSAVDPKLTFYSVKLPPMLVLVVVVPVRLDAAMVNYNLCRYYQQTNNRYSKNSRGHQKDQDRHFNKKLHRDDTLRIFTKIIQDIQNNLWESVRLSSAVDPKLTFYSVKLPPMLVLVVVVPVRLDAAMVNYG